MVQQVISNKIIDLLNYRIQQEEYSGRLYKAIGICMGFKGYLGAEKLFKKYSAEEFVHAEFSYEYLLSLDIKPVTPELPAPPPEYGGLVDVLNMAFEHEIEVTNQCKELAAACLEEGDLMTLVLAQKYLSEQVEEIEKTTTLLDWIDTMGENPSPESLRLLDNHLEELAE
jgi:ferritin